MDVQAIAEAIRAILLANAAVKALAGNPPRVVRRNTGGPIIEVPGIAFTITSSNPATGLVTVLLSAVVDEGVTPGGANDLADAATAALTWSAFNGQGGLDIAPSDAVGVDNAEVEQLHDGSPNTVQADRALTLLVAE